MITHFAEVTLPTCSIHGVKLFYGGQLGLTMLQENDTSIVFRINAHTQLTFIESYEKLAPVHLAFEVPMSAFEQTVQMLRQQCGLPLAWPSGDSVTTFSDGVAIYYKDGDGNLLEWIAHHTIREDVLLPEGPLHVMYLREIGLPVQDVPEASNWLMNNLELELSRSDGLFAFARGGTAHAVVVSVKRKWIPISMAAIPPNIRVVFGTPDQGYIERVVRKLEGISHPYSVRDKSITFDYSGYPFEVIYRPELPASRMAELGLPYSG
jgi:catechol-2,3-dioxygenase